MTASPEGWGRLLFRVEKKKTPSADGVSPLSRDVSVQDPGDPQLQDDGAGFTRARPHRLAREIAPAAVGRDADPQVVRAKRGLSLDDRDAEPFGQPADLLRFLDRRPEDDASADQPFA